MVIAILMIGWSGCKKDDGNSGNPSSTTEKVITTLSGRVFDEQGNFLVGATVMFVLAHWPASGIYDE